MVNKNTLVITTTLPTLPTRPCFNNTTTLTLAALYIPFLTKCEEIGVNGAKAACLSGSANQVINCIPGKPTGLHEGDVFNSLGSTIFLFFIKM